MQHRDKTILVKITSELDIALEMIKNINFNAFEANEIIKRAVCMTVINIGELVKALSDDFRNNNKHIPWRNIAGFRDIAAHKYQTLNMSDVYQTVTNDFPELRKKIQDILTHNQ